MKGRGERHTSQASPGVRGGGEERERGREPANRMEPVIRKSSRDAHAVGTDERATPLAPCHVGGARRTTRFSMSSHKRIDSEKAATIVAVVRNSRVLCGIGHPTLIRHCRLVLVLSRRRWTCAHTLLELRTSFHQKCNLRGLGWQALHQRLRELNELVCMDLAIACSRAASLQLDAAHINCVAHFGACGGLFSHGNVFLCFVFFRCPNAEKNSPTCRSDSQVSHSTPASAVARVPCRVSTSVQWRLPTGF